MNNRNETLTFFTLDDFSAELKRRDFGAVRCESLVQESGQMRTYKIVITAHDQDAGEVLVCTIVNGECFTSHEPWHDENLVAAEKIVVAHLAESGLVVLPGVYHHEQDGRADCDLWTFNRVSRRLIAVRSTKPVKTSMLYAGVEGKNIHLCLRIKHTLDDSGKLPDALRAAIADWLKTPEGADINAAIKSDFNWGDYAVGHMDIPLPDSILSVEVVMDEIVSVDHDERLTGEDD